MNILKVFAAVLVLAASIGSLMYMPLWVYFGFNAIYLGVYYLKNGSFFDLGFVIFAACVSAPLYTYSILGNLIDGKKWNYDT